MNSSRHSSSPATRPSRAGALPPVLLAALLSTPLALYANPLVYSAKGESKGKKLVLIASDHEYRSEETIPALARILSQKHGFDCTVLFGLNANGEIEAGSSNVPGLEALEKADGMVLFTRFLAPAPDQMKHIDAYLQRGGPVVGLRTATHAFNYGKKDDPFYKYHFRFEGPEFSRGFGHQILGQTWVGHYGRNHQQSTRITPVPENASHPILKGVKDIHVRAGGYNAEPAPDWTILTMAQPLNGMEAGSPPDESKKPMASEWTRSYSAADGRKARVFTSLYGASEDLLNAGYRRMLVNAVYWSVSLENKIQPDSDIGFVGEYTPNTFRSGGHARSVKPAVYADLKSPIPANHDTSAAPTQKKAEPKKEGAPSAGAKPAEAPKPAEPAKKQPAKEAVQIERVPVPDQLKDPSPFAFREGDTVAMVGNALADRMHKDGWLETLLQSGLTGKKVRIRNMGVSGDRVDSFPRSKDVPSNAQVLRAVGADVVFAFFGYNESFAGVEKAAEYRKKLVDFVRDIRGLQPNGKSFPRIVLFSPIAHEDLKNPNLPDGGENNVRLEAYTTATKEAAEEAGVAFVDLFHPSQALYAGSKIPLTINGVHLNEEGNREIARVVLKALTGKEAPAPGTLSKLREGVLDKSMHWHQRFRATDENDIWGGRSTLSFVNGQTNAVVLQHEITMLDAMTANRDERVWALAEGRELKVADANVPPPIPVVSNVGGGSKSSNAMKEGILRYKDGEEIMQTIGLAPGFKMELFADEKRFPQLVNPVQMQVDSKGRLWAAAWGTYPKWEPGKPMTDSLLILPDANGDGKADAAIEFAKVHNPLGFEFWNGGVLVTEGPDLIFLKDTNGDDIADQRTVILQGLGTADTHHAANNLILGPDGAIYWQSGIFLVNNIEHPWGPSLNTGDSGMFRFDPRTYCVSFHAKNSPNPHGISFDRWGYHYATDGTGGRAYQVRPTGTGFKMQELLKKEVRPVTASEIVSSTHFPDEMQGDFFIMNVIGFRGIKHYRLNRNAETGDVWGEPAGAELSVEETNADGSKTPQNSRGFLLSGDKNFRPADAIFGEDGALYVADWQNVIIGHMQHNVRDPNRDHGHGRIYRITAQNRPLQAKVAIENQPVPALLENLKHPADGVRHRTHVELSERDSKEVAAALEKWIAQFDPNKKEDAHALLEALWVSQQHNIKNIALLGHLLKSPELHARHAALTVQQLWFSHCGAHAGASTTSTGGESHAPEKKSGVLSDTPELTEVRIGTVVEKMLYDTKEFTVKAGKKVKLTFANPDFMPHNLVVVKPGKADAVGMLAINLGASGFEKAFVPQSPDIVASTKLVDHGKEETIEFKCPDQPGNYHFVCTFPGHHLIMRGTMVVKP